ncbi:hypothetical protein [Micropruina sonneratiae]|uniref:hypothetical protein n=1 Tax=Micropruina sonneratiae TaxID=2986940 RepID=UPI0022280B87|nr:hypothetical protein [Micropruina sp. KQZ13P-5]MCW3159642.1 hypothetical protein [Micropruina sp. KQZ13P-5]
MSDGLFHLVGGHLVAMAVAPYDAEDVLQGLAERYPDLLAGAQMSPGDPRRWRLVRREQAVPDREGSAGRWSVDHLFVDQDAVPTLVEVKRSTDTRIRREVVGQMLDYAANGVRYWPAAGLQAAFEATQSAAGLDPTQAVMELSGDGTQTLEDFFARVETNLRAGRLRLVFVADLIPDELLRIVEFLNEQMSQAEVFAVEVKQYRADGHDDLVIVPRLLGRTGGAAAKSSGGPRRTREAVVAAASEDTRALASMAAGFARDIGLTAEESPTALLVKTPARETLTVIYFLYNSLDVPIQPLRDRGWNAAADHAFEVLNAATSKHLSPKTPSVPAGDALAHWTEISEVLTEMAALYGSLR